MLLSVLTLGFLVGMQHALEADHLAAVSSLVSGKQDLAEISVHGAMWGVGHTTTLLLVAGTCIAFKTSLDKVLTAKLELAVGLMLVVLSLLVFWRLLQRAPAASMQHAHPHASKPTRITGIPWRSLFVGTIHGLAGSAALVLLAASTINEPASAILYVLVFGVGSIIGMAILSAVVALPLSFTASRLSSLNSALQVTIGLVTLSVGLTVAHAAGSALLQS